MRSTDDTAQTTQSSQQGPRHPVSRRDVLIIGTSTAGMMAATGNSSATPDADSSDSKQSSETYCLTITVTGLEVGGPMADVSVIIGDEKKTTDTSGTVVFEVGTGTHEVTIEKERWKRKVKTIEMNGQHQKMHIPMHIKKYNDLYITVYDACLGTPIKNATITVEGYGNVHTDENGTAMVMIVNLLEPTEHDLMVTTDGYHTETRWVKMADTKQLCIELVPK